MTSVKFGGPGMLLEYRFSEISRYLHSMDTYLQTELATLGDKIEEEAKGLTEEKKQEFYEFYYDDIVEVRDGFPRVLFSGFILMWRAMIEDALHRIYKDQIKKNSKDNNKKQAKWRISNARNLIKQASGYEIEESHWQELQWIGKIRNIFAHEGVGANFNMRFKAPLITKIKFTKIECQEIIYFVEVEENFYKYLCNNDIFGFSGLFRLEPNQQYCNHLIEFGCELFSKLISDLYGIDMEIRIR